jgi:hypothetical protein
LSFDSALNYNLKIPTILNMQAEISFSMVSVSIPLSEMIFRLIRLKLAVKLMHGEALDDLQWSYHTATDVSCLLK